MGQLEHIKKSAVIKRSILINGHKTSVWRGLHELARCKSIPEAKLVQQIDRDRDNVNLSSAIRIRLQSNEEVTGLPNVRYWHLAQGDAQHAYLA